MRQSKAKHKCPNCGGDLKKTIGAHTRKKFWECITNGASCFRKGVKDAKTWP